MMPFLAWGALRVLCKGCDYADSLCNYWKFGYWYLLVLFEFIAVQALVDYIELKFPRLKKVWIDIVIFVAIFFVVSRMSRYGGTVVGEVTDLWQFIEYLPYFYLGSLVRRYSLTDIILKNTEILMTVAFAVGSVGYISWCNDFFEMSISSYCMISLCYALLIIMFVIFATMGSSISSNIVGRGLCIIGRNTMIIYMFQFFIFRYLNFGTLFTELYNTNNLIAILAIAIVASIIIAWICIGVGYVLRLSPITRTVLLGKIPLRLDV
jgi:fucose 4-O-acetylase-like acetyltransferase